MSQLLKRLILSALGTNLSNVLFSKIYKISLYGMNYGNGGVLSQSGELYVLNELAKSFRQSKKRVTIFDVGANVGKYTLEILDRFSGISVEVHCFEPSFSTFSRLKENLDSHVNSTSSKVLLNNFGLSNKDSKTSLYTNAQYSGYATIYNKTNEQYGIKFEQKEEISLKKVSDYIENHKIHTIDFIKLDIEGHEFSVLDDLKQLIDSKRISYIQFEFGSTNVYSKTYMKDFFDLLSENYNVGRVLKNGIHHIKRYNSVLEVFYDANFLAELKDVNRSVIT